MYVCVQEKKERERNEEEAARVNLHAAGRPAGRPAGLQAKAKARQSRAGRRQAFSGTE